MAKNNLTYYIETYGCQMNVHDSEKLAGILEELGFVKADKEQAYFLLFNTCCVRENAEKKIFGNVGALKQRKKREPLLIGVCGCMMQQEETAKKLFSMFPFVDLVFGTHALGVFPDLLYDVLLDRERAFWVEEKNILEEDVPMVRSRPPIGSVNIMQGCDNFCSYCIVPYVRGRERSRPWQEIVKEVQELAEQGYREVLLLGQNVNSYGKGLEDSLSFAALLERVAKETDIDRIRFMTSHPKDVSPALIETIAQCSKVTKQLHLPVQSGSSRILQQMNRRYTRESYLALVERVRKAVPGIVLTTDVIVGFPGETEEDFQKTMDLLRQVRFDAAFTFVYSKRQGTRAAAMENQVEEAIKQRRIVELVALQGQITYEKNQDWVGRQEIVLIEDVSKRTPDEVCGRTDGGKMVNLPGRKDWIGQFVPVLITEGKKTTLHGRRIDGN